MNETASQYIVVLVTTSSEAEALAIATRLIEKRLAACVNRVPIQSTYRWQGKIQQDHEWQLVIKTQRNHFEKISEFIKAIHSYEVPEIIALPILRGHEPYLFWLKQETTTER